MNPYCLIGAGGIRLQYFTSPIGFSVAIGALILLLHCREEHMAVKN